MNFFIPYIVEYNDSFSDELWPNKKSCLCPLFFFFRKDLVKPYLYNEMLISVHLGKGSAKIELQSLSGLT